MQQSEKHQNYLKKFLTFSGFNAVAAIRTQKLIVMALKAKNDESKAAKPKKAKKKKKKEILDGERATQAQMHAIKMAKGNIK